MAVSNLSHLHQNSIFHPIMKTNWWKIGIIWPYASFDVVSWNGNLIPRGLKKWSSESNLLRFFFHNYQTINLTFKHGMIWNFICKHILLNAFSFSNCFLFSFLLPFTTFTYICFSDIHTYIHTYIHVQCMHALHAYMQRASAHNAHYACL